MVVTILRGRHNAFYEAHIRCKIGFINPTTASKWVLSICQENGTWSNIPRCTGMERSSLILTLKIVWQGTCQGVTRHHLTALIVYNMIFEHRRFIEQQGFHQGHQFVMSTTRASSECRGKELLS